MFKWRRPVVDPNPHRLERFVEAQADKLDIACRELEAGRKQSHWIWYIFPQMRGLGLSETAHYYGIASLEEAKAYIAHPLLGPRLRRVAALLLAVDPSRTAHDILGSPDDMKLRSCMTLFSRATDDNAVFLAVLQRFYGGEPDAATLKLIGAAA